MSKALGGQFAQNQVEWMDWVWDGWMDLRAGWGIELFLMKRCGNEVPRLSLVIDDGSNEDEEELNPMVRMQQQQQKQSKRDPPSL